MQTIKQVCMSPTGAKTLDLFQMRKMRNSLHFCRRQAERQVNQLTK